MHNLPRLGRAEAFVPALPQPQAAIAALIADELQQVETLFRDSLASPVRIVTELGAFVAEPGGKRVRPMLHLLCTKLCRYEGPHAVLLATVLELIHSATLIHDDVIDGATTRRGQASVNHRWGNSLTVLFGDYLLAKAMEMALRAKSLEVMERLAETTLRMTEGEMLQTRYAGRLDLSIEEYVDLVERKTAALFACCCELAAVISGADGVLRAALGRYGRNLGMAFQVVDDVLDFTGDSATLGKPAASDLREGKATLAVIDLLASAAPFAAEGRELARRVIDVGAEAIPEIGRLTELLHESGAIGRARGVAEAYARAAVREIDGFADGPERRALLAVPQMLLRRDR